MVNNAYLCMLLGCMACIGMACQPKVESKWISAADGLSLRLSVDESAGGLHFDGVVDESSVEITPLETHDSSMFTAASRFFVLDSGYLISDFQLDNVLLFDAAGKFVRKIGRLGKGPGEHLRIADLRYNPYARTVDLYDNGWAFFRYNLQGNLLEHRKLIHPRFFNDDFYPVGTDAYLLYNELLADEPLKRYRLIRTEGDSVRWKRLQYASGRDGELRFVSISGKGFYTYRDTVRFFEQFIPILYNVVDTGLVPRFFIDFDNAGNNRFDVNNLKYYIQQNNMEERGVTLNEIHESDRFLLIEVSINIDINQRTTSRGYFLVDKENQRQTKFGNWITSYGGLQIYIKEIKDNRLYATISSMNIMKMQEALDAKEPGDMTPFEKMIDALNVSDTENDLIISFRLK